MRQDLFLILVTYLDLTYILVVLLNGLTLTIRMCGKDDALKCFQFLKYLLKGRKNRLHLLSTSNMPETLHMLSSH